MQNIQIQQDHFKLLMMRAAQIGQPVVLVLDSLDQLDDMHGGRHLTWLPATLRAGVKVIVSTLPDDKYNAMPALKV